MANTVGKENKNQKQNCKYLLLSQGQERPLLSETAPCSPSRDLGDGVGWRTVDLQRRPESRNSFQQEFYCVLFHSVGAGGVSSVSHFLSSWSRWPSKVRKGPPPWSVSLRTFDWQAAELLFSPKAVAVCLACAKTLHVDCFLGVWAWNVCFSNLLRSVQSEPVSGLPRLGISRCRKSAFWPPSRQTGRRQQSFTRVPGKTCWEHWTDSGRAFRGCEKKETSLLSVPGAVNAEIPSLACSPSSEDWEASMGLF